MAMSKENKKFLTLGVVIAVGFVAGNLLLNAYNKQFSSFAAPRMMKKGGRPAMRKAKRGKR